MRLSDTRMRAGFTLIELMVALSIAAVLLVLAAPTYSVWLADGQILAGAESIAGGLRFAQAEAVKRNEQVQFVLDSTTGTGGWVALLVSDGSTLQRGAFVEGAEKVAFTPAPVGSNTVTFDGLGRIDTTGLAPFNLVEVKSALAGTRQLNVRVGETALPGGGRIKICDPSPQWAANDPKACPP